MAAVAEAAVTQHANERQQQLAARVYLIYEPTVEKLVAKCNVRTPKRVVTAAAAAAASVGPMQCGLHSVGLASHTR